MTQHAGAEWAGALDAVADALARLGGEGWLVGGCLRDALLGVPVRDVDLAVTCEPKALARALKRDRALTIATLNRDSLRLGLRGQPEHSVEPALQLDLSPLHGGSIAADLVLRDFRVNALALPLEARREFVVLLASGAPRPSLASLLDPLGGLADLHGRLLVPASDSALADEPGRAIRAARLVARFGFAASPALTHAMRAVASRLPSLSRDRLRDELNALLALPRAAVGLNLLAEMNALTTLFPNLGRDGALAHALASVRASGALQDGGEAFPGMEPLATLAPLRDWYAAPLPDGVPRIVALRWGLLLHGSMVHERSNVLPEEDREAVAVNDYQWIRLAAAEQRIVWKVAVYGHASQLKEFATESRLRLRNLRHFFEQVGDAGVDVIAAAVACNAALVAAPVEGQRFSPAVARGARRVLDVYFSNRERLMPPRLLTGDDLIRELGMASGREIGVALWQVRQAQLDGQVRTRDEALECARTLL